jgi:predicted dehydrogenase
MVLSANEAKELFDLAFKKKLILMEAMKTAYAPAFNQLIAFVKSGVIGTVKDINASLTKLSSGPLRELSSTNEAGGSITEMVTYPLLPIIKLFGNDYININFYSWYKNDVDLFTRGIIQYKNAVGSFKVGLGVKSEGDLVITGTKGYAYVPAPWWRTEYFEFRFEDLNKTQKYFLKYEGEGLRYEINEFLSLINNPERNYMKINHIESTTIAGIIEKFRNGKNVHYLE